MCIIYFFTVWRNGMSNNILICQHCSIVNYKYLNKLLRKLNINSVNFNFQLIIILFIISTTWVKQFQRGIIQMALLRQCNLSTIEKASMCNNCIVHTTYRQKLNLHNHHFWIPNLSKKDLNRLCHYFLIMKMHLYKNVFRIRNLLLNTTKISRKMCILYQ